MTSDDKIHTLTVRLIRSFEYRTFKNLILKEVDPNLTIAKLKELIQDTLKKSTGYKAFQNNNFDALKLYVKAHGSKTSNLIINLDHDDWFLDDNKTLKKYNIENETEISFFNRALYEAYKTHPETKW
ncbi:hypothetical protein BKA69DRAFT_1061429 [Paraphysoderma sedebokerense]|nr:hypothetical protein BKA69DRAFT_1061429 [Paraphysoderma sedebokerense]